tara:strand:- start:4265 stop:4417 length:153 start_codon:yes stop_codon:yes gene_type:complete
VSVTLDIKKQCLQVRLQLPANHAPLEHFQQTQVTDVMIAMQDQRRQLKHN